MKDNILLDAMDIKIIEFLQIDGRMSYTELGKRLKLSQPSVSERVKRLEDRDIIAGYKAQINTSKLGFGIAAHIRLNVTHGYVKDCLKQIKKMPNIVELDGVTGEDCMILKALAANASELDKIVETLAQYGNVTTSLILKSEQNKIIGREILDRNQIN